MAQTSNDNYVYTVVPDESEIRYAHQSLNRIKNRFYNASARAKQYGVVNSLTLEQWYGILNESNGLCFYCEYTFGVENLCPDHVIPMVQDGANSSDNIVAACERCNLKKGDGAHAYDSRKFEALYEVRAYRQVISYHLHNFKRHASFSNGYLCQIAALEGYEYDPLWLSVDGVISTDAVLPLIDAVPFIDEKGYERKELRAVRDFELSTYRLMNTEHTLAAMDHMSYVGYFLRNLKKRYDVEIEALSTVKWLEWGNTHRCHAIA